jgi:hypothetical protein
MGVNSVTRLIIDGPIRELQSQFCIEEIEFLWKRSLSQGGEKPGLLKTAAILPIRVIANNNSLVFLVLFSICTTFLRPISFSSNAGLTARPSVQGNRSILTKTILSICGAAPMRLCPLGCAQR